MTTYKILAQGRMIPNPTLNVKRVSFLVMFLNGCRIYVAAEVF